MDILLGPDRQGDPFERAPMWAMTSLRDSLFQRAAQYQKGGEMQRAMEILTRHEILCHRLKSRRQLSESYFSQATIFNGVGMHAKALDRVKLAEDLQRELGGGPPLSAVPSNRADFR